MTSRSKFIFKAPFNSLSFGQVSLNLAREMWKRNLDVSIFPISENLDLSSFDNIENNFIDWLKSKIESRYDNINKNTKCLQLWHIRGSDSFLTNNKYLFTFHEILGTTKTEVSICNLHDKVIFSSNFSKNNFITNGVENSFNCHVGFDELIVKNDKKYFEDCAHYILVGKFEFRKNTELIIKSWISKFGNNNDYRLTCLIENPFFSKDIMNNLINKTLNGKKYSNVTILPRLKYNSEVNDLYNSADIDLSGLSSAEGWNLPAFNVSCLGKWSCVANHTSHSDWANNENSILIETNGLRSPYDGAFFNLGDNFNQGFIYDVSQETIYNALEKSINYIKKPNLNGELLKNKFSYDKMLTNLLNICEI